MEEKWTYGTISIRIHPIFYEIGLCYHILCKKAKTLSFSQLLKKLDELQKWVYNDGALRWALGTPG